MYRNYNSNDNYAMSTAIMKRNFIWKQCARQCVRVLLLLLNAKNMWMKRVSIL